MRIPTYISARNQTDMLTRQFDLVNRLQVKINTGKKLLNSSDDPILGQNIKAEHDYIAQSEVYKNNIMMGKDRTTLMETSVTTAINEVRRAMELITRAQSDTSNNTDRQNIARELQGILTSLQNNANTRDANRDYIFSGTSTNKEPFALINGTYQYTGSYDLTNIDISSTNSILYNACGQSVFGDMMLGNGVVVINAGAVPNQGTVVTSVPGVTNNSATTNETYTLSFVTNSSGQMAYQVIGSISGQVIPAPPQTVPADAPPYTSGSTVNFNGINFNMTGTPVAGDTFSIAPSSKQNIMQTLQQTINLLNTPVNNPVDTAAMHQQLNGLSASVNTASNYLTNRLSEIGYRGKELADQEKISADDLLNQKAILDQLESADQYELISEYSGAMTTMQYTQEAYRKLQEFFEKLLQSIL